MNTGYKFTTTFSAAYYLWKAYMEKRNEGCKILFIFHTVTTAAKQVVHQMIHELAECVILPPKKREDFTPFCMTWFYTALKRVVNLVTQQHNIASSKNSYNKRCVLNIHKCKFYTSICIISCHKALQLCLWWIALCRKENFKLRKSFLMKSSSIL